MRLEEKVFVRIIARGSQEREGALCEWRDRIKRQVEASAPRKASPADITALDAELKREHQKLVVELRAGKERLLKIKGETSAAVTRALPDLKAKTNRIAQLQADIHFLDSSTTTP